MSDDNPVSLDLIARKLDQLIQDNGIFRDDMRVQSAIIMRLDTTVAALLTEVRALHAQVEMRALKRQMEMLHAHQAELPTLAQFQAGLTDLDRRVTELHAQTDAAIQELTAAIHAMMSDRPTEGNR